MTAADRWPAATAAAALTTCGLVVAQALGELGVLSNIDLAPAILLGLTTTGVFVLVSWSQKIETGRRPYARRLATLYAAGALAFAVGVNGFTSVFRGTSSTTALARRTATTSSNSSSACTTTMAAMAMPCRGRPSALRTAHHC